MIWWEFWWLFGRRKCVVFRVSIGKRKGFDLGLQGRMKKEGFIVFWWAPHICGTHMLWEGCSMRWSHKIIFGCLVAMNSTTRREEEKREKKGRKKNHVGQYASMLKALNSFINKLPLFITLCTNICKDSFLY